MKITTGKLKYGDKLVDSCVIELNLEDVLTLIRGEVVAQLVCDGNGEIVFQHAVTAVHLPIHKDWN